MKLKPIGERVIVELIEIEEKTSGGIYLPEKEREKNNQGRPNLR